MKKYSLFIFTLIALLGLTSQAQAWQVFDDETTFNDALSSSAEIIITDISTLPDDVDPLDAVGVGVVSEAMPIPLEFTVLPEGSPFETDFGQLSFPFRDPDRDPVADPPTSFGDVDDDFSSDLSDTFEIQPGVCARLDISIPAGSTLEGFSLNFIINNSFTTTSGGETEFVPGPTLDIKVFADDATTPIAELASSPIPEEAEIGTTTFGPGFFGWINETGANVTRIEICIASEFGVESGVPFGIETAQFVLTSDEAPAPTCREQLQSIIGDLNAALTADAPVEVSENDEYLIAWAIDSLEAADSDALFETDDRLSSQGVTFFRKIFAATFDLEKVSARDVVLPSLNGIQDVLSCLVDNEIAFAEENDGSDRLIAYAEFFDENAERFADAELFLQATWLHFYAWLFATNA